MRSLTSDSDVAAAAMERMRRLSAFSAVALFAVTWRLWTPQTVFPQIPFVATAGRIPPAVEFGLAGLLCVSLILAGALPARFDWRRWAWGVFAVSAIVLIAIDQHRLQPWAYQFVLIAVVLCGSTEQRGLPLLRLLVIGIYFHSALSKFDASFLDTHGQQLTAAAAGAFGVSLKELSDGVRRLIAASLPIGELVAAAGLFWRRTRRIAVLLSVLMHAVLLLALGPWGLDHKPAVLIWNLFFVAQNIALFWEPVRGSDPPTDGFIASHTPLRWHQLRDGLTAAVIYAATLLPFLEPFGYFDHWPAWALYASHPERVTVTVRCLKRDDLPENVRRFTEPESAGAWCRVDLDRWSLETLNVPVYPQGRYRLAVAAAVAARAGLGEAVAVVVESPANRITGNRQSREIRGTETLQRELDNYWLNTRPRENP